jgi:hypothetical protein
MVAMISSGYTARRPGAPTTALARVAFAGHLQLDEMNLVDGLMLRLYAAGLEPIGHGPAEVVVVGRQPFPLPAKDLARANPKRVVLVVPFHKEPRHDDEARIWHELLPNAHILFLELDAVRKLGLDESARISRVSLAACWAVPTSAGALPMLPRTPLFDADC